MYQEYAPDLEYDLMRRTNQALEQELFQVQNYIIGLQSMKEAAREKEVDEASSLHLRWWLKNMLSHVLDLMDATEGSVLFLDEQQAQLEYAVVSGSQSSLVGHRVPLHDGTIGWVVQNREACVIPNAIQDTRHSPFMDVDLETEGQVRSVVAAPLISADDVLGVVEIINQGGEQPFNELHRAMLGLFCEAAGEVLSQIKQ